MSGKHSSIIGGSTAKRRIHCTGSAALEAQFPERNKSDWAREGDALHWLVYTTLDADNIQLPERGMPFAWTDPEDGETIVISPETMDDKFFPAIEGILDLIERHDITEYDLELTYSHTKTCDERVFGTLDFVGRSANGYIVVADFKFGSGVKEFARENYQLAFYTVGLWEGEDPFIDGAEKIVFAIIQPWRDDPEATVDEWETDTWWVESFRQQEKNAFTRIINKDTSLKAGPWCQFCKARPACPEQNQSLETFERQTAPPALPADLSVTKLATLLDMGERAAKQYEILKDYATELAETQGVAIPGWKVIESMGHRRYKDPKRAMETAVSVIGTEAFTKAPLSPAQMQKKFKKLKEDFSCMEEHIERPSRGGRLVRDDNPAPEIATARDIEIPDNLVRLPVPTKRNKKER